MSGQGTRLAVLAAGAVLAVASLLASALAHQTRHPLPKSGGSHTALAPIPAPGKYFGFNDHTFLNKRRYVPAQRVAALAARAGANIIRYQLPWKEVEPARNVWDEHEWDKYQAIDRAFAREGIRSLIVLGTTPSWARKRGQQEGCTGETGCEFPPAKDEIDHWAEYAAEVARRLQSPVIETWNEPNLALFFKPNPNPSRYARMHVAAYNAIKRARPRTKVLLAGNANTQLTGVEAGKVVRYGQRDFLRRIYPAVKGHFDGISLHPYLEPPPRFGRRSLISHALNDVRSVQAHFNDRGHPLWITETGISTTGPRRNKPGKQASGLLSSYRQLMTMADVKSVLIHTLFDQTDFPANSRGWGYGMIRHDFPLDVKPAYCAFNGRAGRGLVDGCTKRADKGAPGARRARRFETVCRNWLRPLPEFRRSKRSRRTLRSERCLLDLQTIEASGRGRVRKLRERAAAKASYMQGGYRAARGRAGISLSTRAVERLARWGYMGRR